MYRTIPLTIGKTLSYAWNFLASLFMGFAFLILLNIFPKRWGVVDKALILELIFVPFSIG
jgi:hypothetical protein